MEMVEVYRLADEGVAFEFIVRISLFSLPLQAMKRTIAIKATEI
jgi:hypothetical protein